MRAGAVVLRGEHGHHRSGRSSKHVSCRYDCLLRTLSFQRDYACRHSGACCTAGWIEPDESGRCRFHDAHPDGGCRIQRESSHESLPRACQQFPRVATLSPAGTSVTLSAFCPTAASLLFGTEPFTIVDAPDTRALDGLDARGVLPPLLRDGMLMDWEAVARWEQLAVETLSAHRDDADRALALIDAASTPVIGTWTPADGTLSDALAAAFSRVTASGGDGDMPGSRDRRNAARARYFASHAFACWPMYNGQGIRGALDWLLKARTALDAERRSCPDLKEAVRRADLALRHRV